MAVFSKLEQIVMTDETLGLQKKKRMEKQKFILCQPLTCCQHTTLSSHMGKLFGVCLCVREQELQQ